MATYGYPGQDTERKSPVPEKTRKIPISRSEVQDVVGGTMQNVAHKTKAVLNKAPRLKGAAKLTETVLTFPLVGPLNPFKTVGRVTESAAQIITGKERNVASSVDQVVDTAGGLWTMAKGTVKMGASGLAFGKEEFLEGASRYVTGKKHKKKK